MPPLALLLGQLVLMLGTPVAVGMFVRRRWPALADVWRTPLQLAAMGGIVGVLIFILTERLDDFARLAPQAVPLALLFTAGSAVTGWGTGAVTAVPVRDRFTLSAEFSTRNVAVAMAIAVSMLGQLEFVVFGSIYFVVEIVLLVSAAAVFRARMR